MALIAILALCYAWFTWLFSDESEDPQLNRLMKISAWCALLAAVFIAGAEISK